MTKREAMRRTMQDDALRALGFTRDEADKLRRISMTLHRWHELECGTDNGCVVRDEKTNKPFWQSSRAHVNRYPIADRETGALKRLARIIERRNDASITEDGREWATVPFEERAGKTPCKRAPLSCYVQTDPRGAALYVLRPGDVPAGENADSFYTRGICVY